MNINSLVHLLDNSSMLPLLTQLNTKRLEVKMIKMIFSSADEFYFQYRKENYIERAFDVDILGPKDYYEKLELFIESIINSESPFDIESNLLESFNYLSNSMSDFDALFDSFGIDIPDGLDLLPGAPEIILGARLLMDYKDVKKEFNNMSAENQNRVIMAKTLVTLSRFGVTTTLTTLGGISGGAVGGAVGGVGAVVGGPAGALTGAYTASQLNKKIMPHSREMIFSLLNIDIEDLFYYKNKEKIDTIGQRLRALKLQLQNEG